MAKPVYAVVEGNLRFGGLLHRCCGGRYLCGQGQHRPAASACSWTVSDSPAPWRNSAWSAVCSRRAKTRAFWTHSVPRQKSSVPMRKPCWTRSTSNSSRWSKANRGDQLKSTGHLQRLVLDGQQTIELGLADQLLGNPGLCGAQGGQAEDIIDYTRHENASRAPGQALWRGHGCRSRAGSPLVRAAAALRAPKSPTMQP